jgi:hypothetical protein
MNILKQPPVIEDLRNHSPEQLAELRMLITSEAPERPDPRRPRFYEIEGANRVYYVFKYPSGVKVLLVGIWDRDPVAQLIACASPAA